MSITIADVEAARRTIAGQVLRTPMLPAPKLSALTGAEIFVKYENLQVTNSFKDRDCHLHSSYVITPGDQSFVGQPRQRVLRSQTSSSARGAPIRQPHFARGA